MPPATSTPALALIGADGEIEQSTETFRLRYKDQAEICRHSPQIERVLAGDADRAMVTLEDVSGEAEAVLDAAGMRHVLLTLPGDGSAAAGDANALLSDALEESPAIGWQKDLDGRYLQVNRTFTTLLGASQDTVKGKADLELSAGETIDGPRVHERGVSPDEPLQFEYTVPSFEKRPAMAVLRFPVRDLAGNAIAVCGVAAPFDQADVARAEAARLFEIERWSRLDPSALRSELLTEWGMVGGGGAPAGVIPLRQPDAVSAPPRPGPGPGPGEEELRAAREQQDAATALAAERAAELEKLRAAQREQELAGVQAAQRAEELESALAIERARSEGLERSLAQTREQLEGLLRAQPAGGSEDEARVAAQSKAEVARARSEAERARAEVGQAQAELEQAQGEAAQARAERGPGSRRGAGGPGRGGVCSGRSAVGGEARRAARARRAAAEIPGRARRG